jgi:cell division protein FtsB
MKLAKKLDKLDSDDEELKDIDKLKTGKLSGKKSEAAIKKKAKNDLGKFLPTIIM